MKVQNKVILVTGGGSGMGRELVLLLLSKSAKVVTIDINENALKETVSLAASKRDLLRTFVVDITNKSAVEQLLNDAITAFGSVAKI